MKELLGIYLIKEKNEKELRHALDACPAIAKSWDDARALLKNSVFCDYLEPEIVIWGKRYAVTLVKNKRPIRAMNRLKAYKCIYNALTDRINGGKAWLELDKSGDEIFATLN